MLIRAAQFGGLCSIWGVRYFDFHIGGDSLDVSGDWQLLNSVKNYLASVGSKVRGVVLEENGGLHSVQRALGHARRSNRLQCLGDFILADTPANGLQVLGISFSPLLSFCVSIFCDRCLSFCLSLRF